MRRLKKDRFCGFFDKAGASDMLRFLSACAKTAGARRLKKTDAAYSEKRPCKIGVMGSGRGNGTTHLAIMLANYCANGCGLATAAIEYGSHRDYMKICDETRTRAEDIRHFSYKGIVFHTCCSSMEVANCLLEKKDVVVLDLNACDEAALEEFFRCDIRIAVGAVSLWKLAELQKMMKRLESTEYVLAVVSPDDRRLKEILDGRQTFFNIPIEPNPFYITSDTMYQLKSLLHLSQ